MARSASSHAYDDEGDEEDEEELEDEEEDEEPAPRRRPRSPPRRDRRRAHRPPVRRWRATEAEEEDEAEEEVTPPVRPLPWRKKPIYWRARDSLFFEPLVALAIIVVLLVSLFAYTQNWPPVYVVESNSMQHGSTDQLGLINAGDLVLAQKIPFAQITPYVVGLRSGYSTYGEPGDVVLYYPNGQGGTPVIHRALLYLEWNPAGYYNATDLNGLRCGTSANPQFAYFATPTSIPSCATTYLNGHLELYSVGWNSQNVSIDLTPANAPSTLGDHSGLLTMGDNNTRPDQSGPAPISSLVEPGWIIGAARGMIPWFGSLKLLLDGNAGLVPAESWELMGLTIVGVILGAFGIHYALRREGIETPLRREEEEEEREEEEAEPTESPPRRWPFHWRRKRPEDEEEEDEEATAPRRRSRRPPSHTSTRRGRPVPHVRRAEKPKKRHPSDDDEL